MQITLPNRFINASNLRPSEVSQDPRRDSFPAEELIIDARGTEFIRPAAVLWCVIYPLLARSQGRDCRFIVPENMGVCVYLQSLGLFDILGASGVQIDVRGIGRRVDSQVVLPLTGFSSQNEVEKLANSALDSLSRSHLGASNMHPFVSEVFAELGLNAVEHALSPIGAFGFIQFYEFQNGRRFLCGVADGGIGIRQSLEKNSGLKARIFYDWDAIELATRERISGTGSATRGIGLFGVAEDMRSPKHQLIIHSGIGRMEIRENLGSNATRTGLFPGTLAYASIPT